MPLVHMALDAEIERGIGDPDYEPSGECLAVLLELGADPTVKYLGESVIEGIGDHAALTRLRDKFDRWLDGRT